MVNAQAERELDRIADMVLARIERHEGRVSWMRIRCPRAQLEEVRSQLPARMAEHGLDFIHIDVHPGDGEASIEDMGFDPGWA